MRCHYEVLSLPHNADDNEIKKAYRKLALQYHPDKNIDNSEEFTELFREVQSAYDVLSDPQERAFYDKHREEILKGGGDFVDDAIDVMYYFNSSIWSGFEDDGKSFYTIFRDAFCKLAKEDEPYMENEEDFIHIPDFGYSSSDYETVVRPFYIYWLSYRTKKTFVWKQVYDIRTAANRPTQRLMEKENKKLRDSCRKKRNEEVRALVSYVRKRDKRVQAEIIKMKEKQEQQQRKAKEIQEAQKKDRSKILENYEEQEWMAFDDSKLDDIDSHYDNMFGNTMKDDDSEESDCENVLYCIACDKNFKSDKALANHEKSKKHKENVELIKSELESDLFEELHIGDSDKESSHVNSHENEDHICEDYDDEEVFDDDSGLPRLSSFNLPANIVKRNVISKGCSSRTSVDDYEMVSDKKAKKKQKKKKKILFDISENSDPDYSSDEKNKNKSTVEDSAENISVAEEAAVSTQNIENNSTEESSNSEKETATDNLENDIAENCVEESNIDKKDKLTDKGKKNKKSSSSNNDEGTGSFTCEVCPKVFPTRNKLFKHIKAEGHAVLKEANTKKSKKEKGKKK